MSELDGARLRTRAESALASAGRLVDQAAAEGLDDAIVELVDVEGLIGSPQSPVAYDDTLVWRVRVTLGALYARRWLHNGWAEADKTRGLHLLRAARAAGHLNGDDDFSETLLLAVLLLPGNAARMQFGTRAGLDSAFDISRLLMGGGQVVADLRELRELLGEACAARPGDPRAVNMAAFAETLGGILELVQAVTSGTGMPGAQIAAVFEPLTRDPANPAGSMISALLPFMLATESALPPRQSPPALEAPGPGPDGPSPAALDELAVYLETVVPGTIGADELPEAIARIEQAAGPDEANFGVAALGRLAHAMRTNDPGELDGAIQTLRAALQSPATGADQAWLGHTVFPAMLAAASMAHGNRQDAAKAAKLLQQSWPTPFTADSPLRGVPGAEGLVVGRLILNNNLSTSDAWDLEDDKALEALLSELEEAERNVDPAGELYCLIPFQTAVVELCLTVRREDVAWLRRAVRHLEAALDASATAPAAVRSLMDSVWPAVLTLSSYLEQRPAELTEAIARARASLTSTPAVHDQHVHTRLGIALALKARYASLDDAGKPPVLDEMIDELEQARAALTERSFPTTAATVGWELAEAYRQRGDSELDDDSDIDHAVDVALESLRLLSGDVLLQIGTEDGLRTAKAGAGRGLRTAGWALAGGRVDAALECLELGRALVLSAAATAGTIPERLRTAGEVKLAEEWERAPLPGSGEDPLSVPSDLRQRGLRALRRAEVSRPLASATPSCSLITEELSRCGVDALVYLLPETAESAGRALVIRADGTTRDVALPGLCGDAREPFDRYLNSSAQRFARLRGSQENRDLEPGRDWKSALDELCEWAGHAVLDPLIDTLPAEPTPDRPARIVFVPCGLLGLVPWQAALLSRESSDASPTRPTRACDLLVISYAASAAELLRSLAREQEPYHSNPVFVVDPTRSLRYAGIEATAIRDEYLHAARFMGFVAGQPVEAPGTPQDVLAQAMGSADAAPASMVQISAHGTAGTSPTASRLRLAAPTASSPGGTDDAEPAHDQSRSPGVGPEYLTLARILESARPGETGRVAPLIVLDCCETDLSSRDHDEALTLTTAFVARGAADVIGSRWSIDDWSTAVCIVVFHHFLAVRHLAPVDALRAAQRWMLGPDAAREPIAALTEELLGQDHQPLEAVSSWAPFIHQGNARLV